MKQTKIKYSLQGTTKVIQHWKAHTRGAGLCIERNMEKFCFILYQNLMLEA